METHKRDWIERRHDHNCSCGDTDPGATPKAVNRAEIVEHCANLSHERGVVQLREFAIKFGSVSDEEVANHRRAYEILNPNIVIVPKVYCYFTEAGRNYLVMEYIEGETRGLDAARDSLPALARAVAHVHSFTCNQPGPVDGGGCTGTLWPQDEHTVLQSCEDLERRVKARLFDRQHNFCLADTPFVFTHGDLNLRNVLFVGDRICLLDWEFGGYFPRSAEIAILYQDYGENVDDLHFRDYLAKAILEQQPLTDMESDQVTAWLKYTFNNIRFSWTRTETESKRKKKKKKPTYADAVLRADDNFEVPSEVDVLDTLPPFRLTFDIPK